jgi:serpin B
MIPFIFFGACSHETAGPSENVVSNSAEQSISMLASNLNFEPNERAGLNEVKMQADLLNTFSLNFYRGLNKDVSLDDGVNLIFPPLSIRSAFGMLYSAAEEGGSVQKELSSALVLNSVESAYSSEKEVNLRLKSQLLAIEDSFSNTPDNRQLQYRLVNQVFVDNRLNVMSSYLDTLKQFYNAAVGQLAIQDDPEGSRKYINLFVSEKTQSMIKDLLPKNSIEKNTSSVLINSAYMKADWEKPFAAHETSLQNFVTANGIKKICLTMKDTDQLDYYSDQELQAVSKPYAGGKVAMLIIVPKTEATLSSVLNSMTSKKIRSIFDNQTKKHIELHLPKFSFEWGTKSIKSVLKSMGLTSIFTKRNAFPRFLAGLDEIFVRDVFHKAKIVVEENGTQAAAATAIVPVVGSARQNFPIPMPIEVRVNKPSLFFIYEKLSGSILFMGRISMP